MKSKNHKKAVRKPPVTIQYPTWKIEGRPTPTQTLYVCDTCGKARWDMAATGFNPPVCYEYGKHPKGGMVRMRKATTQETAEGNKCLKNII